MSNILEEHDRLRRYLTTTMDPLGIEQALAATPMIQQEAGELFARAIRDRDIADDNVKLAKANAADRLRQIPVNGKEPSQTRIDSLLPKDREVQEAEQALRDATYEFNLCRQLCESLKTQNINMNKYADYVISGYFKQSTLHEHARAELRRARVAADEQREVQRGGRIARPTS